MPKSRFTRRDMLKMGASAGAGSLAGSFLAGCSVANQIAGALSGCAKITDIDHVVILIQENRSFDHYFGSYKGVRGFNDNSAAFQQPYPGNTSQLAGRRAAAIPPRHRRRPTPPAPTTSPTTGFPSTRAGTTAPRMASSRRGIPINATDAVMTMGYYTRADLPYYYAAADAFTLCDNYFCPGDRPQRSEPPLHHGRLARP